MASLTIALTDGFTGQAVVVRVDGRVVLDEERVRTRPQIGLAREIAVTVQSDGQHTVAVFLPTDGIEGSLTVDATVTPAVLVAVREGAIELQAADRTRHM
jgi:hypothetical protein